MDIEKLKKLNDSKISELLQGNDGIVLTLLQVIVDELAIRADAYPADSASRKAKLITARQIIKKSGILEI